ncbi:MAG: dephospho-CoA kinase [Candidatus Eremiobacterota bacterium]
MKRPGRLKPPRRRRSPRARPATRRSLALRLGLTGGIASGKSTVAERLRQHGAVLLDADQVSRDLTKPGSPVLAELAASFGAEILRPDGSLDRPRLGRIAFADPSNLARLNSITHPPIWKEIHHRLGELSRHNPVVVLMAPLLLEHGGEGCVDQVWVVHVSPQAQLDRLVQRDGLSEQAARERVQAQMAPAERLKRADVVIDNSGPLQETLGQVDAAWRDRILPLLRDSGTGAAHASTGAEGDTG